MTSLTLWRTLNGPTNWGLGFLKGFLKVPGGEPDVITRMEHGISLLFLTVDDALDSHVGIFHTSSTHLNHLSTAEASFWLRWQVRVPSPGPGECPHLCSRARGYDSRGRIIESSRRDRVSAMMYFEPGRYVSVKSNLVKKRAHLACRRFSRLTIHMYSRFRWLVRMRNGSWVHSSQCL
jgi:hypothetical protein